MDVYFRGFVGRWCGRNAHRLVAFLGFREPRGLRSLNASKLPSAAFKVVKNDRVAQVTLLSWLFRTSILALESPNSEQMLLRNLRYSRPLVIVFPFRHHTTTKLLKFSRWILPVKGVPSINI